MSWISDLEPVVICFVLISNPSKQNQAYVTTCTSEIMTKMWYVSNFYFLTEKDIQCQCVLNILKQEFAKTLILNDFVDAFIVATVLIDHWLFLVCLIFPAIIYHVLPKAGIANMVWVESFDVRLVYCTANIR